jgi:hypothetical protein
MLGADSSHVRLFADSRYQDQSTFPSVPRGSSLPNFHAAPVGCRSMTDCYFRIGVARIPDSSESEKTGTGVMNMGRAQAMVIS